MSIVRNDQIKPRSRREGVPCPTARLSILTGLPTMPCAGRMPRRRLISRPGGASPTVNSTPASTALPPVSPPNSASAWAIGWPRCHWPAPMCSNCNSPVSASARFSCRSTSASPMPNFPPSWPIAPRRSWCMTRPTPTAPPCCRPPAAWRNCWRPARRVTSSGSRQAARPRQIMPARRSPISARCSTPPAPPGCRKA